MELVLVHRLVLFTFVRPALPGEESRHLNGKPGDNRLANLQWGTRSENQQDRVAHGISNRGERCGSSKLTELEVRRIRTLFEAGLSDQEIAESASVSRGTIHSIRTRKSWAWLQN